MKEVVKNLAALIKVKTIVTVLMVLLYAVLALKGTIKPDSVSDVMLIVIGFYFGTQHEKRNTELQ